MTFRSKMVGIQISVPERAKQTLDRQAASRGLSTSLWAGQLFDAGFAAVCAREKSMPATDADLDAIVGAALLLRERENWDVPALAQALGVPEAVVDRILDAWQIHRLERA
ncbi:MAG: helix-turn-helix protein [Rhizobium sp.]|nr:helix-turn-helix protein [Rhizobium sp.]